MSATTDGHAVVSSIDPFSDGFFADLYGFHNQLREAGRSFGSKSKASGGWPGTQKFMARSMTGRLSSQGRVRVSTTCAKKRPGVPRVSFSRRIRRSRTSHEAR
jgi:hypothetical protein